MKKKTGKKKVRATKSEFERLYRRYFVQLPNAVDEQYGGSLEQPSPFKSVPSVVTYGIGQQPIVGYRNAELG